MFLWCSGYHVRLTRGRSSVQSWAETIILLMCNLQQMHFQYRQDRSQKRTFEFPSRCRHDRTKYTCVNCWVQFEGENEIISFENNTNLHRPGIEPGPPAWQASILPLNHRCCWISFKRSSDPSNRNGKKAPSSSIVLEFDARWHYVPALQATRYKQPSLHVR
jgi:hypothetical protein